MVTKLVEFTALVGLFLTIAAGTVGPIRTGDSAATGLSTANRHLQQVDTQEDPFYYRDQFPQEMRFQRIGLEAGLSNPTVYAVFQDSSGYMWFGTEDGLNRYDGYEFTFFKNDLDDPHSLANNVIINIMQDRNGNLWLGTYGGGLNRFDPTKEQFERFQHDPDDPHSLSNDYVIRILEDNAGLLWLTTEGGGLNRFDQRTGEFTAYRHDPMDPTSISHDIVTRVLEDSAGNFWVGTEGGGLNLMDREAGTFQHFTHDPADPTSLSHDIVWAIREDRRGELWIGTFGGGINRFDRATAGFRHYRHEPAELGGLSSDDIRLIYEDRQGDLWAGTLGAGINRFDRETDSFVPLLTDPEDAGVTQPATVLSMFEDPAGVLWVGTAGSGVFKHTRGQERYVHLSPDLDGAGGFHGEVGALFEDSNDHLWLGTWGGGLHRYDREQDAFLQYAGDPTDPARSASLGTSLILEDQVGTLWLGTFGEGVAKLDLVDTANWDPATASFGWFRHDPQDSGSLAHDIIWSGAVDEQGTVWFGTHGGLDALYVDADEFAHFAHDPLDPNSLSNNVIRALYADGQGTLWIGTDEGLNRMNLADGQISRFVHDSDDPHSLSTNLVVAIGQDIAGDIWAGTWGGGLNRYDPASNRFTRYTEKDGLPSGAITEILPADDGGLWLSTPRGLSRFNPANDSFINYDQSDGLRGVGTGSLLSTHTGELMVADNGGLTVFNPAELALRTSQPPPIVLTSLTQGGESLPTDQPAGNLEEVVLNWPRNFFEFEFAALSYAYPEKNRYAYMLAGFDQNWNEAEERRFAQYTNLPGGRYTLRIRGSSGDGVWNQDGYSLEVVVVPPLWQTWWFRGAAGIFLLATIAAAFVVRGRSLESRRKQLEAQVSARTRELGALYNIAAEASRSLDMQDTLDASLETTLAMMAIDAGGICLLSGPDRVLKLQAHRGLAAHITNEAARQALARQLCSPVIDQGQVLFKNGAMPAVDQATGGLEDYGFQGLAGFPLVARNEIVGAFFLLMRQERNFSQQDAALLTSIGRQIGVAVEQARLFASEQRRAEQFRVIGETGLQIASILDIDELLRHIVALIQSSFGYYHVALGLVDGDELVYEVGAGELWQQPGFELSPARLKRGVEGLGGWVAGSGEPLFVPDVRKEPRYIEMAGSTTLSELVVPIIAKGEVIGVLDAQSNQLADFDESDLVVMQSLAFQAGVAIDNARLYSQARDLAVMAERSRLARELHDAVTQSIYSLTLLAEAGKRMIERDERLAIAGNQERIGDIAQQALQEMRLLVFQLRPSLLSTLGLAGAIEQRLEIVERRAGIGAHVTFAGCDRLMAGLEEELYRITLEALNNALKHAQATAVSVQLLCAGDQLTLIVTDNGRGFEPLAPQGSGGLGLRTMQERADMIAGTIAIESAPGSGTTIRVSAPIQRESPNLERTATGMMA